MPEADFESLLAKIALSDRSAFDTLYAQSSSKLFAVAMRILKDQSLAEDALQEIFIKIWQKAATYRAGQQTPMAWLVTIARNHSIDVIRANRRVHDDIEDHYDLKSSDMDPEQASIASGERSKIDDCLQTLDSQKAEAVVAAYVEGFSYLELAERYAVPLNTMRTWLRRSLLNLRDCLENG